MPDGLARQILKEHEREILVAGGLLPYLRDGSDGNGAGREHE